MGFTEEEPPRCTLKHVFEAMINVEDSRLSMSGFRRLGHRTRTLMRIRIQ